MEIEMKQVSNETLEKMRAALPDDLAFELSDDLVVQVHDALAKVELRARREARRRFAKIQIKKVERYKPSDRDELEEIRDYPERADGENACMLAYKFIEAEDYIATIEREVAVLRATLDEAGRANEQNRMREGDAS